MIPNQQDCIDHNMIHTQTRQSGATLIELIVSIVVISIALTGLMLTISLSMKHSSDAFIQIRAAELAQAYMDMLVTMEYHSDNLDQDCGSDSPGESHRDDGLFHSLSCYENYADKVDVWIIDFPPWNIGGTDTIGQKYSNYCVRFRIENGLAIPDTTGAYGVQGKMIYVNIAHNPPQDCQNPDDDMSFATFRADF